MEDLIIGSHVSFTKKEQLLGSLKEALKYNENTFMFYTGAPQNTKRNKIDLELTKQAYQLLEQNKFNQLIVHAPYIINLANKEKQKFSIEFLKEEIKRCEQLKIKTLVLHPGSHVGYGIKQGLDNIVEALNKTLTKEQNITICLETMSGKGTELGTDFKQLKYIIDNCYLSDKIGICLDTCHLFDNGYDISNFDKILDEIDQLIGIDKIKCIHINDSKNNFKSHKDRHANIGFGLIGFDNLIKIIYNNRLKKIPKILETPFISLNDKSKEKIYPPYKFEIEMIKKKQFNQNMIEDIRNYYK